MKRYTQEELTKLIADKFLEVGTSQRDADLTAEHLVYADMHGINTHGSLRTRDYIYRINEGYVNLEPKVTFTQTTNNTIYVDGDNGLGMPICLDAVNKGLELIKKNNGIVMVGCTNLNHTGTESYYLNEIAKAGYVGMSMCIAHPQVAPYGGSVPYFGTNPFGFGAPIKDDYPLILDMATSIQAWGKVMVAKARGEKIPEGWALDKDGKPTTDPDLAVNMLPFGGAKGYGIMLMVNVLSGVMLNTPFGYDVKEPVNDKKEPQKLTHLFVIFDPAAFMDKEKFLEDMATMKKEITSQKPAQGFDSVRIPGQRSFDVYQDCLKNGIKIEEVVEKYLNKD